MRTKILILKNRKIIEILWINVEVTCDLKNLTLYIYYCIELLLVSLKKEFRLYFFCYIILLSMSLK